MILMHKVVIDILSSFDETQFGIFEDDEQATLKNFWDACAHDVIKFSSMLSPAQKTRMAMWASHRTSYPVKDLAKALKKFGAYLESNSYKQHDVYPKHTHRFTGKKSLK